MTPRKPVLGLVPARAGSKGIVGKNMRLISGDPMIAHTLRAAADSGVIDRLIVSTEGNEIAQWCRLHGYEVLERPDELGTDEITIAQVARHVVDELEWDGIVVALLPTSPLRGAESIARAVERAQREEIDSLATVVREPKLFWYDESEELDDPKPLYAERVNRQYGKHGVLRETGAILLVTTDALRAGGEMVGQRHRLMELPYAESIDIDTYDDLVAARRISEQGRIIFRLSANWEVGSGHLWSCLALAEELTEHDVAFLLWKCDPFVTEMLDARGYRSMTQGDDLRSDLETLKNGSSRNLLVNDMLDTTEEDVLIPRALGYKVVNVDDLGRGRPLRGLGREPPLPRQLRRREPHLERIRSGTRRPATFTTCPPRVIRREPERILVLFGGTDPRHNSPPAPRPAFSSPAPRHGDRGDSRPRRAGGPELPTRGRVGVPPCTEHGGQDARRRPWDDVGRSYRLRGSRHRNSRRRARTQNAREATHAHLELRQRRHLPGDRSPRWSRTNKIVGVVRTPARRCPGSGRS